MSNDNTPDRSAEAYRQGLLDGVKVMLASAQSIITKMLKDFPNLDATPAPTEDQIKAHIKATVEAQHKEQVHAEE